MENVEFANLEGISSELKHKFATDFIAVISKVKLFLRLVNGQYLF